MGRLGRCAVGAMTVVVTAVGAASAAASVPRAVVGSVTPRPHGARVLGQTSASRRLRVTVELQPRNPLALKAFATAVSTPGSAEYGHFLTVGQFAQRFGATPAAAARVAETLRHDGLQVGALTRNNMELPVSGTVARMQRAFAVREQRVRMPNGRIAYANAQTPTLPVSVAPDVQAVIGLDDLTLNQPAGFARDTRAHRFAPLRSSHAAPQVPDNGGPQPCSSATDVTQQYAQPSGAPLTADQLATAYGFSGLYGQGDFGQGQTVALFEQENFSLTDVQTFGACYGISINPQVINVAGGPAPNDDEGESELDIEVVASMDPRAAIQVYQGPQNQTVAIYNAIVAADQAKVISSSWGECETLTGAATITAENTILQEAAAQGQSFFISSGDSGSAMCYQATFDSSPQTQLSVIDPGGQPFATGVGGTNVYTQAGGVNAPYQAGDPVFQSVWNDGIDSQSGRASAGGGGLSSFFTMPSYQSSAPASLGVQNSGSSAAPCGGSTDCREVPDVSANADPNTGYAVYTGGTSASWAPVGGTSAAAPLWASYVALANASATCRGLTLGFVNPSLYAIAGAAYNSNFDDITSGSIFDPEGDNSNNPFAASGYTNNGDSYPVLTGYDMATGLGSMNAGLAQSLCAARAPVYSVTVGNPGTVKLLVGHPAAVTVHATDSGGVPLGFAASGLPAGLAISPSTGEISGTPTTLGSSTVTVAAADNDANSGSTQFRIDVVRPDSPKASRVSLKGLGRRRPVLTFTMRARQGTLRQLVVKLPRGLSFARSVKGLRKGISMKAGRRSIHFKAKVRHGVLTLTPRKARTTLTVVIQKPALAITRREAHRIKTHRVKSLKLVIGGRNTLGGAGTQKLTVKRLS